MAAERCRLLQLFSRIRRHTGKRKKRNTLFRRTWLVGEFAIDLFTTKHFGNQEMGNMSHKYSIGSTVTFPGHEGQAEIMAVTYKKPYRYDLEYENGKEIVYDVPEADIVLVQAKVKK